MSSIGVCGGRQTASCRLRRIYTGRGRRPRRPVLLLLVRPAPDADPDRVCASFGLPRWGSWRRRRLMRDFTEQRIAQCCASCLQALIRQLRQDVFRFRSRNRRCSADEEKLRETHCVSYTSPHRGRLRTVCACFRPLFFCILHTAFTAGWLHSEKSCDIIRKIFSCNRPRADIQGEQHAEG